MLHPGVGGFAQHGAVTETARGDDDGVGLILVIARISATPSIEGIIMSVRTRAIS